MRTSLVALLAATAVSFAFDVGATFARGWYPGFGYLATCAGLAVAGAAGIAAAVGWVGGALGAPSLALGSWVALNVLIHAALYVPARWMEAAGLGAATWLALLANDRRKDSPVGVGVAVGLAFAFCATIAPRAYGVLGIERPRALYGVSAAAMLAAILLAHALYSRWHGRIRWLPPATPLTLALGLVGVLLVPSALTGPPTQTTIEPRGAAAGAESPASLVLVLVLDTVRADRLSLYGYHRDTTPSLRNFARRHERTAVYPLAFSPASWTLPAHASLFTGLIPSEHGAHSGSLLDLRHALAARSALAAEATLAEVMRSRGYRTAAILANAQVMFFNGMDRGFDQVVRPEPHGWLSLTGEKLRQQLIPQVLGGDTKPYPLAATINRELLRYVDDCAGTACFAVVNYMEAHWPFMARAPYQGTFTGGVWPGRETQRYDEELLGLDAALGELLAELERRGLLDRTWLVITADHGEEFGPSGAQHGTSVMNDQVRIPLVIHPPLGEALLRRVGAVDLLDVTATLTAASGAPPLGHGRDLRGPGRRPVQIEWFGDPKLAPADRVRARAVVAGRTKLVEQDGVHRLYRLDSDPNERKDVSSVSKARVRSLIDALPPLVARRPGAASSPRELPVGEVERLKALGYAD